MKLHELGAQRPTEHIAKTLKSHMGHAIDFDRITEAQARKMLSRTQTLLREWRTSVSRHYSERNPDYIKLVMVEQALKQRMSEQMATTTPGVAVDPRKQAALATAQQQQHKRDIQDQIKVKQKEISDLQRAMNSPVAMAEEQVQEKYMGFKKTVAAIKKGGSAKDPEAVAAAIGRKKYGKERFQKAAAAGKKLGEGRRLREGSELQTAQVVLASQDMIDRIQGMMEDISEMQFKDLPALTDSIKNDMGVEQASQFQSQASAALTNLLAAVQAGKTELEGAQGVLTGAAPQVPGATPDAAGMPAAAPAPGGDIEADLSLDANLPPAGDEDEEDTPAASLGRERR
jgi:hypothetical protein